MACLASARSDFTPRPSNLHDEWKEFKFRWNEIKAVRNKIKVLRNEIQTQIIEPRNGSWPI